MLFDQQFIGHHYERKMSNSEDNFQIHRSWLDHLKDDFDSQYMKSLMRFLREEQQAGKDIYPPKSLVFSALNSTPLANVNVVILGQDPYHGPGQAHGLSFSVPKGVAIPPSLLNIFKELKRDYGFEIPKHGCLDHWAKQGVLLLNTSLTVEKGNAGSHSKKGWQILTDKIIALTSENNYGVVYMLWGAHAQAKSRLIDQGKHLILSSAHPSPLSAYRGFLGNGHFRKCNEFLASQGKEPIRWSTPSPVLAESPGLGCF